MVLIGLGLTAWGGIWARNRAEKSKIIESWPTTQAYVIESRIMWDVTTSTSARNRSASYYYKLVVTFGYTINGRYFVSSTPATEPVTDSILFGRDPWKNEPNESMISFFRRVPQGCLVPVYYNPQDLNESYIFPRLNFWQQYGDTVFMMLFGLAFAGFPLAILILMFISRDE